MKDNFCEFFLQICCGYSEVPLQGTRNDYPQIMFSWRNKQNNLIKCIFFAYCKILSFIRLLLTETTCVQKHPSTKTTVLGWVSLSSAVFKQSYADS